MKSRHIHISAFVGGMAFALAMGSAVNARDDQGMAGSTGVDTSLSTMSVEQLEQATVINAGDEKIGEIESIVRDPNTGNMSAVVGVGGFLGLGEKDIAIPVDRIESTEDDDEVVVRDGTTSAELKAAPEYEEERYEDVPDDTVVDLRVAGTR